MLRVDNKKEQIEIIGDSEQLKEEIGTLMLALCGETAKVSKGAAEDMYMSLAESIARVAVYLELKCGVKLRKLRKAVADIKEEEKADKYHYDRDRDSTPVDLLKSSEVGTLFFCRPSEVKVIYRTLVL